MSKLNHPHLLSFLGHCTQTSGDHDPAATVLYLVYEYIPNGTYRAHLSGQIDICSKLKVTLDQCNFETQCLLECCCRILLGEDPYVARPFSNSD